MLKGIEFSSFRLFACMAFAIKYCLCYFISLTGICSYILRNVEGWICINLQQLLVAFAFKFLDEGK